MFPPVPVSDLPPANAGDPVGPSGIRLNAAGLLVGLECYEGKLQADVPVPLDDNEVLALPIN
jgi:hypothetical protein